MTKSAAQAQKNRSMRKTVATLALLLAALHAGAQTDEEYRMEIGGGLSMVTYEGDFGDNIFTGMQPGATVMLRRIVNPYMGFRLAATYGRLKGSSDTPSTYYPDYADGQTYTFDNTLIDCSLTYEYNFWPYGTGEDYRGAKRLTPFVFAGLGATYVTGGGNNVFTANVPLGLGVKYKVARRLNVGLEWAIHFSLSDKLDGVADPYGISSSGLFKNTDCYSAFSLSLTYSFMPKCRTCHNDMEKY